MHNDDETRAEVILAALVALVALVAGRALYERYLRARECQAIEQATYDSEFWELVGGRDA
jgi:hypothetical protein